MLAGAPIQNTMLDVAFDPTGYELLDGDFCYRRSVFSCSGCLAQMLRYGCYAEASARKPADALEGENRVERVRYALVLGFVRGKAVAYMWSLCCLIGEAMGSKMSSAYYGPFAVQILDIDVGWCCHISWDELYALKILFCTLRMLCCISCSVVAGLWN